MTREKANRQAFLQNKKLIDKIYEDFESRTCENCKWHDGYCNHEFNSYKFGGHEVSKDFGCNKFERIEDD